MFRLHPFQERSLCAWDSWSQCYFEEQFKVTRLSLRRISSQTPRTSLLAQGEDGAAGSGHSLALQEAGCRVTQGIYWVPAVQDVVWESHPGLRGGSWMHDRPRQSAEKTDSAWG